MLLSSSLFLGIVTVVFLGREMTEIMNNKP